MCPVSIYGEGACEVATPPFPLHTYILHAPQVSIYPSIRGESLGSLSRLTDCKGLPGLLIVRSHRLSFLIHTVCPAKNHNKRPFPFFFFFILSTKKDGCSVIVLFSSIMEIYLLYWQRNTSPSCPFVFQYIHLNNTRNLCKGI